MDNFILSFYSTTFLTILKPVKIVMKCVSKYYNIFTGILCTDFTDDYK